MSKCPINLVNSVNKFESIPIQMYRRFFWIIMLFLYSHFCVYKKKLKGIIKQILGKQQQWNIETIFLAKIYIEKKYKTIFVRKKA